MERTDKTDIEMLKLLMTIFESAREYVEGPTKQSTTKKMKRPRGRPIGSKNKKTIDKLFDINYVLENMK
jgi:hypothetical protein